MALAFKASNFREFFGFGFAAFIFATIAHFSIEKEVALSLFGKADSAYQTNETGFAFNMLCVLAGILIGLAVFHAQRFIRLKQAVGYAGEVHPPVTANDRIMRRALARPYHAFVIRPFHSERLVIDISVPPQRRLVLQTDGFLQPPVG